MWRNVGGKLDPYRRLARCQLPQECFVRSALVIADAREQRIQKEFGIGHAFIIAVVMRGLRIIKADENHVLFRRALF